MTDYALDNNGHRRALADALYVTGVRISQTLDRANAGVLVNGEPIESDGPDIALMNPDQLRAWIDETEPDHPAPPTSHRHPGAP